MGITTTSFSTRSWMQLMKTSIVVDPQFPCRNTCLVLGLMLAGIVNATEPMKPELKSTQPRKALQEFRSQNLIMYTDLPQAEAEAAVKRLEQTLDFAIRYWGKELRGQIECY